MVRLEKWYEYSDELYALGYPQIRSLVIVIEYITRAQMWLARNLDESEVEWKNFKLQSCPTPKPKKAYTSSSASL